MVPLRVVTLVSPSTGRCTHIVSCERTHAAALVDPAPELAEVIEAVVDGRGLRLRLVLWTAPVADAEGTRARYRSMLGDLGLRAAAGVGSAPEQLPWKDTLQVGPTRRDAEGDRLWLRAGSTALCLDGTEPSGRSLTVAGSGPRLVEGEAARELRVALGAFHLHAVPFGQDSDRVAWSVVDRVFTGVGLWAGGPTARSPGAAPTPPAVLELHEETLVYPGLRSAGLTVSTIDQERWWREREPEPEAEPPAQAPTDPHHRHLRLFERE